MQNFTTGLLVALQGIIIVFAELVILMLVLKIMKLFAKDESKNKVSAPKATPAPAAVTAAQNADNDEIIAVIAAAVASMSGNDVTKRLRVMSIKRQGSAMPIWSAPRK